MCKVLEAIEEDIGEIPQHSADGDEKQFLVALSLNLDRGGALHDVAWLHQLLGTAMSVVLAPPIGIRSGAQAALRELVAAHGDGRLQPKEGWWASHVAQVARVASFHSLVVSRTNFQELSWTSPGAWLAADSHYCLDLLSFLSGTGVKEQEDLEVVVGLSHCSGLLSSADLAAVKAFAKEWLSAQGPSSLASQAEVEGAMGLTTEEAIHHHLSAMFPASDALGAASVAAATFGFNLGLRGDSELGACLPYRVEAKELVHLLVSTFHREPEIAGFGENEGQPDDLGDEGATLRAVTEVQTFLFFPDVPEIFRSHVMLDSEPSQSFQVTEFPESNGGVDALVQSGSPPSVAQRTQSLTNLGVMNMGVLDRSVNLKQFFKDGLDGGGSRSSLDGIISAGGSRANVESNINASDSLAESSSEPAKSCKLLPAEGSLEFFMLEMAQRELQRFVSWERAVYESLAHTIDVLSGRAADTSTSEGVAAAIGVGEVPSLWSSLYCGLADAAGQPLARWTAHVRCRGHFLKRWAGGTVPSSVWFGGLLTPQDLLTSLCRWRACSEEIALDSVRVWAEVVDAAPAPAPVSEEDLDLHFSQVPDGEAAASDRLNVHGFALAGADWTRVGMCTQPVSLVATAWLPPVDLLPLATWEREQRLMRHDNFYACPVFRRLGCGSAPLAVFELPGIEAARLWTLRRAALYCEEVS
mmetsp:Transcript_95449/g.307684  ORF Transcript_95449/g.307684 Transcript_95449/m.307684 type:complete len:697 (-) Transcript_95449:16-2106(-)